MTARSLSTFSRHTLTCSASPFVSELCLNAVPDHRGDVWSAESLDRADAGGRGDVDFGEVTVDHVDTGEHEPAHPQRRSEPLANRPLAIGQVCGLRGAAPYHVGAQIVRLRHAVHGAGELAIDQNDAFVALHHGGEIFLHDPGLPKSY